MKTTPSPFSTSSQAFHARSAFQENQPINQPTNQPTLIYFSLIASTLLSAGVVFTNPLGNAFKSTDNGGTLAAIDAYKDGIGVEVVDNLLTTDNSAMNTLVYKYGDVAKVAGKTIISQVFATGITADITLVGAPANGTSCNDNNIITINDIYTNGVCAGTLTVNGTVCTNSNPAIVGSTWLNGVCQGGSIPLIWDNCEAGSINGSLNYLNAVAYCSSKGMRLPTLAETIAGGGTIPSCLGWTWTSTPLDLISTHNWYNNISMFYPTIDLKNVRCVK